MNGEQTRKLLQMLRTPAQAVLKELSAKIETGTLPTQGEARDMVTKALLPAILKMNSGQAAELLATVLSEWFLNEFKSHQAHVAMLHALKRHLEEETGETGGTEDQTGDGWKDNE